jgi:TRAP-type C4-dicarboxylate transport system permease small subunit
MSRAWALLLAAPAAIAGAIVLAMVLGITASVAQRALTGAEIRGMTELTEIGLYLSALLAAPWLLARGAHIRADLLGPALPRRAAQALEAVADVIGIAVCLAVAWQAWQAMQASRALGSLVRRTVTYPEWWLTAPLAPVFLLLAIEFARRLAVTLVAPDARRTEARSVA